MPLPWPLPPLIRGLAQCDGIARSLLLAAWAGLAAWQHHEYGHERQSAREDLSRQAEALMKALVGGPGSHPRLGFLQCERLQEALDQLAASGDVLAAKIVAEDSRAVMTAGTSDLLAASPVETGGFWDEAGLRYAIDFHAGPQYEGGSQGPGGGAGRGRGGGKGWGGLAKTSAASSDLEPFQGGGRFVAVLLLDRSQTDETIRRAFGTRCWLVAAGGLVLVCVAVAWRTTVRLVEARGRARVLEAEARHLRDLGQAAAGLAHETRNPLGLIRGWTHPGNLRLGEVRGFGSRGKARCGRQQEQHRQDQHRRVRHGRTCETRLHRTDSLAPRPGGEGFRRTGRTHPLGHRPILSPPRPSHNLGSRNRSLAILGDDGNLHGGAGSAGPAPFALRRARAGGWVNSVAPTAHRAIQYT